MTHAIQRMQQVMGELPGDERRVAPDVRVVEEQRGSGLWRRKIRFATEPDDAGWAWLYVPAALREPAPAMLCPHQTTPFGKDEPAGLDGLPNLHYALELAQRGYITLAPDYPNFGDYHLDVYALGYASATTKGIWNHMRAVDVLQQMDEVDANRIGCIGHSLGGHNTLFAAAFDERIRCAVSSCGFTLFRRNWGTGDIKDWSHKGYMPRIAEQYDCDGSKMPFDFEDVLSLIAPRPVFVNAPEHDAFVVDGVRECADAVRWDELEVAHPDCKHDFPPDVREQAYAWLDAKL